jgi:serine/threonine protein kinase
VAAFVTTHGRSVALTLDPQFELLLRQVAGVSATPTGPVAVTPPLPAGASVGPYRLLEVVGAGGIGVVYRAHDSRLQRDVALKLLPSHTSLDDAARERLLREARAAARLLQRSPELTRLRSREVSRSRISVAV